MSKNQQDDKCSTKNQADFTNDESVNKASLSLSLHVYIYIYIYIMYI